MRFWKMNGIGNDFIILNNMEEKLPPESFPALAKRLCHRQLSIGADGLMIVEAPTMGGDFKMLFYNADGTMGEMCGNGARCICRYGYENGLAGETQTVETTAGIVTGERVDSRTYKIRLNDPPTIQLGGTLEVEDTPFNFAYVELGAPGVPHAVVPFPGLENVSTGTLKALGRVIRWHECFPKGANVNFYDIVAPDTVVAITFERGVEDFTLACGTGAGSITTALTLLGKVSGKNVRIVMPGGELYVTAECSGSTVENLYLTGLTNIAAKGEVTDEEL